MTLMSGSVQQLPQKLDVSSFHARGENICRHRRSLDQLETRFVAGLALLDHAELNSETFVLRRLARRATGNEESICQALAIVLAQCFCRLEKVFLFRKTTQVSATFAVQHSKHVSVFQTSGESCTLSPKRASHNLLYLTRVPCISLFILHFWTEFFFNQYYHNS